MVGRRKTSTAEQPATQLLKGIGGVSPQVWMQLEANIIQMDPEARRQIADDIGKKLARLLRIFDLMLDDMEGDQKAIEEAKEIFMNPCHNKEKRAAARQTYHALMSQARMARAKLSPEKMVASVFQMLTGQAKLAGEIKATATVQTEHIPTMLENLERMAKAVEAGDVDAAKAVLAMGGGDGEV